MKKKKSKCTSKSKTFPDMVKIKGGVVLYDEFQKFEEIMNRHNLD